MVCVLRDHPRYVSVRRGWEAVKVLPPKATGPSTWGCVSVFVTLRMIDVANHYPCRVSWISLGASPRMPITRGERSLARWFRPQCSVLPDFASEAAVHPVHHGRVSAGLHSDARCGLSGRAPLYGRESEAFAALTLTNLFLRSASAAVDLRLGHRCPTSPADHWFS